MEHDVNETGQMAVQLWANSASSEMSLQLLRLPTAKKALVVSSKGQFVNNYPIESKMEQVILRNLLGTSDEEPYKNVHGLSLFQWHRFRDTLESRVIT